MKASGVPQVSIKSKLLFWRDYLRGVWNACDWRCAIPWLEVTGIVSERRSETTCGMNDLCLVLSARAQAKVKDMEESFCN